MKKLTLAIAILFGLSIGAMAQNSGLFQRGYVSDEVYYNAGGAREESPLILPGQHGSDSDTPAPLGSGIAVLIGLGAAYAASKKRNNE